MNTYNARVAYETRKGNLKTADIDNIMATSLQQAETQAANAVRSNKQRQCSKVHGVHVKLKEPRRGIFARFFRRG